MAKRGRPWDMNSQYGKGKILQTVAEFPGLSAIEICNELGEKTASVYRSLSDLTSRGYIEKSSIFPDGPYTTMAITVFEVTTKGIEKLNLELGLTRNR